MHNHAYPFMTYLNVAVIGKLKSKEDFGEKEIKLAIDQRTLNMGASRIRR